MSLSAIETLWFYSHLELGCPNPRATKASTKRTMSNEEKPERKSGLLRSSAANVLATLAAVAACLFCSMRLGSILKPIRKAMEENSSATRDLIFKVGQVVSLSALASLPVFVIWTTYRSFKFTRELSAPSEQRPSCAIVGSPTGICIPLKCSRKRYTNSGDLVHCNSLRTFNINSSISEETSILRAPARIKHNGLISYEAT